MRHDALHEQILELVPDARARRRARFETRIGRLAAAPYSVVGVAFCSLRLGSSRDLTYLLADGIHFPQASFLSALPHSNDMHRWHREASGAR